MEDAVNITDRLPQAILATEADAILVVDRGGFICFLNPGAVSRNSAPLRRRLAELQNQFGTGRAMMPVLELGKTPSDFTFPGGPVPHPGIAPFQGAR